MVTYIWPPQSVSVSVPPTEFILDGVETTVSRDTVTPANSDPFPVINLDSNGNVANPLTDAELRASPVPVSGPLTDAQLRATSVPVSGPLTDAELRATPVPISGTVTANTGLSQPLTDAELRATPVPVSGPLTDVELRATPVPVSGTVTANTGLSQPLTDAELRATPVPVSVSGVATEAKQDAEAILIGSLTETAPASDTASSGLNGRLQRIAQRLTSLIALFPTSLGAKTSANSFSITPASDAVFTINTESQTGDFSEDATLSTSAETITAPAGAFSCFVEADDTNTTNIRVKMGGGAATTSSGIQFQPGRSEYYEGGSNLSVCMESGTGKISVQWFIRS